MFSGSTVWPNSKEIKLGSSDQEQVKNWGDFSAMFTHGSAFLQLFLVVWICVVLGVWEIQLLQQSSQ